MFWHRCVNRIRMDGRFDFRRSRALTGALLYVFLWVPSLGCWAADGPPGFMVEQDVKKAFKTDKNCDSCVRLSQVRVAGMETRKRSATVWVEVVGDWVGCKDCRGARGPCSGFSPSGGMGQVVSKKLRYRKLDDGWRLETNFAKSGRSGRRSSYSSH